MEYEGKVALKDSDKLKKELWNPLENWFRGSDDPNYIVLEIYPVHIKQMNKKGKSPNELDFQ